jgi:hypothetical protein
MTGHDLRDEGVARVDRATDADWKGRCDSVIRTMAQSGLPFTAEDVREWVGNPPRQNAIGSRFLKANRDGIIDKVGYRMARRPEAHSRVVAVYEGRIA